MKFWAFAGVALGVLLAGQSTAGVREGNSAWETSDYDRAVAEWRPAADAGDPAAQFNLGQAYKLGQGVTMNMKLAQDWYLRAARQGHAEAEDNLGLLLFRQGDRMGAMPWIRKAAERGEPRALYVLGTAHFNGDLAVKDWPRAYALMKRAADTGLPQAKTSFAQIDRYMPKAEREQAMALLATMRGSQPPAQTPSPQVYAAAPVMPPASTSAPQPTVAFTGNDVAVAVPPANPVRSAVPDVAPVRVAARVQPPVAAHSLAPRSAGNWKVQLGAFGTADGARNAWNTLSSRVGALTGLSFAPQKAGAITRLQAAGLASKGEAERVCRAVVATGAGCFPVAP